MKSMGKVKDGARIDMLAHRRVTRFGQKVTQEVRSSAVAVFGRGSDESTLQRSGPLMQENTCEAIVKHMTTGENVIMYV